MIGFVRRLVAVAASAAALTILSSGLPQAAQEPSRSQAEAKPKSRTGKRALDPIRRVPMYFGQLGLSDEQRESIYKAQAKHMPRIEALEKQIEQAREAMMGDCEAVLTSAQKQLLQQRRAAGAEVRAKKSGPAAPKK